MSRVIPQADDWLIQVMVVTKNAQGRCLKIQAAGFGSGLCNPARGENAQYVPMAEDERVSPSSARTRQRRDPRAHRHRRPGFPAGTTVLEQTPAGALGPNV